MVTRERGPDSQACIH